MNFFLLAAQAAAESGGSSPANYLLDILVVVVLIGYIIGGAKKGFVNCFFKFISSFVAILVAIALAGAFVNLTGGLFGLQETLADKFVATFEGMGEGWNQPLPWEYLQEGLVESGFPKAITDLVTKMYSGHEGEALSLGMVFAGAIGRLLTLVIATIVLFIILKIVIFILRKTLTALIEKIPLVNKLNGLLGAVFGFLQGIVTMYILLAILSVLPIGGVAEFLSTSIILGFLWEHNFIMGLLSLFVKA